MTPEKLGGVLTKHKLWLDTNGQKGKRANLENAYLEGASLRCDNLREANLRGGRLRCADLAMADLKGTDLKGADLRCTDLKWANLQEASLQNTNMTGANLRDANLSGADLTAANLTRVRLWDAVGNDREIKSLQLDTYSIAYTFDRLQIGCENHSIEEWRSFSDETIQRMDHRALDWWKSNKDFIFDVINRYPATPTGHEQL